MIATPGDVIQQIFGLAWSPNGRFLALSAATDSSSEGIYIATVRSGSLKKITEDSLAYGSLVWSPGGTTIAAVVHDTLIHDSIVMLSPEGTETGVRLSNLGAVEGMTWAPDASRFAYAADGKLYLVDSTGNNVEQIVPD